MTYWQNWSGRHRVSVKALHFLHTEEDACALAVNAAQTGTHLRCVGSGHSHAPLVTNEHSIVDLSGLTGVISTDPTRSRAWVWAGTPIYALGRALHDADLALSNQGDIDRQTIGGAVATGTHGTGHALTNLSARVTGACIALASGELKHCTERDNTELWQAARLNLGALGIITRLELQLQRTYRLQEHGWTEPFDELQTKLPELIGDNRHFEFFWYPQTDKAVAKRTNITTNTAHYPLASEGQRCAWNYEVLSNHRPHLHTEMEYSVPAQDGLACFNAIRALLRTHFPDVHWPVEYRTLAADDVWLSTAYRRETVTISVHQTVGEDETAYYQACERIFLEHGGRPHWGKVHYLDGEALATRHPCWQHWWTVRNTVDPTGAFLNEYLAGLWNSKF